MEIVTPVAQAEPATWQGDQKPRGAPRTWGFVDTSKVNADLFLHTLAGDLAPVPSGQTHIRKPSPGYALTAEQLNQLANSSDAVVLGFGDCGTSTYYAVRDAAGLERLGTPAVVICSDAFTEPATALAAHFGLNGPRLISLPHPLASRSEAEITTFSHEVSAAISVLASATRTADATDIALRDSRTLLPDDADAAQEEISRLGWTDGLPVVLPSRQAVAKMVSALGEGWGADTMPAVPPAQAKADLECWAANCVMAGCQPNYFPVVVAAMEALLDPASGLSASQVATNTSAPLLILNGPVRELIDAEARYSCLGSGNRANATIGRAVRLILRNVGGELPGLTDLATHGQPGKISYCFAENEEESPWEPWHVYRGFDATSSTVTTVMASPPQNIFTYGCNTARDLLNHLSGALTGLGHNNIMFDTGPLLVLGPEHAGLLAKEGYTRKQVQSEIFDHARIEMSRLPRTAQERLQTRRKRWFELTGITDQIGVADRAEDVHLVVAGAPGIHSQFVSTAFSKQPVTKIIPQ